MKRPTLTVGQLVGRRVRLHSPYWLQGYCDGECVGYDDERCLLFFRAAHDRNDAPLYEVRAYGRTDAFTLL